MPSIQHVTTSPGSRWRDGPGRRRQPGWCPGGDQVARAELDVATQVRDDLGHRGPHLGRPAVLDGHAVDRTAEPEIGRIELVGRDDPRTDRTEPRHRLAEQPLVAVEPRITRRDVVDDRVAEDVVHRRGGGHVPGCLADHDAELAPRRRRWPSASGPSGASLRGGRPTSAPCRRPAAARARDRAARPGRGSSARPCRSRRVRGPRRGPSRQAGRWRRRAAARRPRASRRPSRRPRSSARTRSRPAAMSISEPLAARRPRARAAASSGVSGGT